MVGNIGAPVFLSSFEKNYALICVNVTFIIKRVELSPSNYFINSCSPLIFSEMSPPPLLLKVPDEFVLIKPSDDDPATYDVKGRRTSNFRVIFIAKARQAVDDTDNITLGFSNCHIRDQARAPCTRNSKRRRNSTCQARKLTPILKFTVI